MNEEIKQTIEYCLGNNFDVPVPCPEDIITILSDCIHFKHTVKDLFIKHTNLDENSDSFVISGQGFSIEFLMTDAGLLWPKK